MLMSVVVALFGNILLRYVGHITSASIAASHPGVVIADGAGLRCGM